MNKKEGGKVNEKKKKRSLSGERCKKNEHVV